VAHISIADAIIPAAMKPRATVDLAATAAAGCFAPGARVRARRAAVAARIGAVVRKARPIAVVSSRGTAAVTARIAGDAGAGTQLAAWRAAALTLAIHARHRSTAGRSTSIAGRAALLGAVVRNALATTFMKPVPTLQRTGPAATGRVAVGIGGTDRTLRSARRGVVVLCTKAVAAMGPSRTREIANAIVAGGALSAGGDRARQALLPAVIRVLV
jgi:hypothetical protein